MSPTFSGGGFTMEVVNADDRDELIRVFTKYKVVAKKNPMTGSGIPKSDHMLEPRADEKPRGNKHAVGTQTRESLIRKLGIDSDAECDRVREEIENHPQWGNEV